MFPFLAISYRDQRFLFQLLRRELDSLCSTASPQSAGVGPSELLAARLDFRNWVGPDLSSMTSMSLVLISKFLAEFEPLRDFLAHQANIWHGKHLSRHLVASTVVSAHRLAHLFKAVFLAPGSPGHVAPNAAGASDSSPA